MKKMILVLVALTVQSASATTFERLWRCESSNPSADAGYKITVTFVEGLPGSHSRGTTTAVVEQETIAGLQEVGSYDVTQSQGRGMGAPINFDGNGFNLEIEVDTAPTAQGIRGHFSAETESGRISDDVYCLSAR